MEEAGLREQLGRAAHEYLLLAAHAQQPCLELNARCPFRTGAAVWLPPTIPRSNGRTDRTEMDVKFGELRVEAKLARTDFQTAPARLIERGRELE